MPYIGSTRASRDLAASVLRRALRRLRRLHAGALRSGDAPAPRSARLRGDPRRVLLGQAIAAGAKAGELGSGLRALASALEQAERLAHLARASLASKPGRAREAARTRLFEEVAATPHLRETAPRQVADAAFARRALRLAGGLRDRALGALPALTAPHVAGLPGVRFPLPDREDPELALARGEHALGGAALLLALGGRGAHTLELAAASLVVRRGERVLLEAPRRPAARTRGPGARIAEREHLAPGASVRLGRRLRSGARSLRVAGHVPGIARRLAPALALLSAAWPEAAEEVELFTDLLVPLDEPGTVSYSLPARPGVSYVNVRGKTRVELADDLLHETAHHKLHAIEELEPLTEDDGAPLWWSPWRSAWRPLRGMVHACYTFTYGALLFARLSAPAASGGERLLRGAPLRFARRRLLEEEASLGFALRDLARARRRGLLAPAGDELRREMEDAHRRLVRPAAREAEAALAADVGGRQAAATVARLRRSLEAMRRVDPGREQPPTRSSR